MSQPRQISIILNDRSYEYDVYTLVIAFFQGVRTQVFDPGSELPSLTDLTVRVMIEPGRILLTALSLPLFGTLADLVLEVIG